MAIRSSMVVLVCALLVACEGPAGPAGDAAERVVHRTSFDLQDDTDDGLLTRRALRFDKLSDETSVRISYYDSLAAKADEGSCVCHWDVLINDASCDDPGPIAAEVGSIVEQTYVSQTVIGWCDSLSAGQVDITVSVSTSAGTNCDCLTGFGDVTGMLEAEELD